MATWKNVSTITKALEGVEEGTFKSGELQWRLAKKLLAWERPLRKSDLEALGDDAPKGAVLAVWVPDLETKDILVTGRSEIYFTTPHFKGYAIVLVRLSKIGANELRELITEAWRAKRPPPKKRAVARAKPKTKKKTKKASR